MFKRSLLPAGLLLAGAIACGPASSPSGGQQGTTSGPKMGGQLNVRVHPDPFNWDITFSKSTPNDDATTLTYSSLLGFKMGPDLGYTDLIVRPELAQEGEVPPA